MAVIGRQQVVITGEAAVVRLGYQQAALLGAWRVEGTSFTADVKAYDGFRITQTPLTLEVQYADSAPIWRPLADVSVTGGRLSARLLPRQEL